MKYRKSPLQIEKYHHVQQLRSNSIAPFPRQLPFTNQEAADFVEAVKGKVVFPWTPGYNTDRLCFDNVYPAYPSIIVYVAYYEDIKYSLEFAQKFNLQTTIRSAGHSFACYSICDGMVIDVSQLNNIYVNTKNNTAFVECGCTFDQIFPVIEQYGLHMPGGGCPTVSVSGFMQGGGYGITSRAYGMNCDCVLECTVMRADGSLVLASEIENPDLFWAIRGGTGGNFGVLLNITYQLYPLGNIYGLQVKWVIDSNPQNAAQAIYTIQENYLLPNAFPNLGIETVITTDTDGVKKVFFCATWIGTDDALEQALTPLKAVPGAQFGTIKSGKYSDINSYVLEGTPNVPDDIEAYSRSAIIERSLELEDWINILTFFYNTAPNQYSMIDLECYGGMINSIPVDSNAFIHRNAKMDFFCLSFFNKETNDQQQCEIWLENLYKFMAQYSNGHSYQNYPDRNQENFRWAYWGQYYNQLVAIKNKYDPDNFFKYQQSIGPNLMENSPEEQITLFGLNELVYETHL